MKNSHSNPYHLRIHENIHTYSNKYNGNGSEFIATDI